MSQLTPFGIKLKEAMAEKGMRDAELAKKMGVKPPLISYLKYKTKKPRLDTIRKIAKILGKPEAFFDHRFVELEEYKSKKKQGSSQKDAALAQAAQKLSAEAGNLNKNVPSGQFNIFLVIEVDGEIVKKLELPTIGV